MEIKKSKACIRQRACKTRAEDERKVVLDADLCGSTMGKLFEKEYPVAAYRDGDCGGGHGVDSGRPCPYGLYTVYQFLRRFCGRRAL